MNTTEKNKLISEFMGYENVAKVNHYPIYKIPNLSYEVPDFDNRIMKTIDTFSPYFDDMKFSTDWNWLIPVIEKIESLGYYTNSDINFTGSDNKTVMHFFRVYKNGYAGINIAFSKSTFKIESIYTAVIEFIKWYNLNK